MRRIQKIASAAFLFIVLFNVVQLVSPSTVSAKVYYMAGIKDGDICSCPVTVGDCVCRITLPD
jgi:hypothetical protein